MAKRLRICAECLAIGRELTFENGNMLRRHRRSVHPVTAAKHSHNKKILVAFRREAIIKLVRGTT